MAFGNGVHTLFEQRVEQSPESTAVTDVKDRRYTYATLNEAANRYARFLRSKGIQPGDKVAIKLPDKPAGLMVIVLAILKAGAAYLPVNNQLKLEAVKAILKESGAKQIIVPEGQCANYAAALGFDTSIKLSQSFDASNLNLGLDSQSTAYLIYTSGSTGKPKGVQVTHANIKATFASWKTVFELTPEDTHLQMANPSFDVFTGDWVRALCSGAGLYLYPTQQLNDPKALGGFIRKHKITVAEFVPVVLKRLAQHLSDDACASLRVVMCGSDNWTIGDCQAMQQALPQTVIFNTYGTTEATVDSTYFRVTPETLATGKANHSMPIGQAFPHANIIVGDERGQPVPEGAIGEIYIGGAGVSKGYVDRSKLNRERFVIIDDQRYFRTGDQAQWKNGQLALLGRNQFIVNINGERVELPAVEAVLSGIDGVEGAVVIPYHNKVTGDMCLLAYLACKQAPDYAAIQLALQEHLPPHCFPKTFFRIDRLPVTANGKVSRVEADLDALGPERIEPVQEAQCTSLQSMVRVIWSESLGMVADNIPIDKPFCELGGDSLKFVSVRGRLQEAFKVSLQGACLGATVADLAKVIEFAQTARRSPAVFIPKGNVGHSEVGFWPSPDRLKKSHSTGSLDRILDDQRLPSPTLLH